MNDIKVPPFTDGLKEIIEATEKHKEKCDKISTNVNKWGRKNICDVDGIDDDITDLIELLEDTISRIEGLTNEEWLRSCTTEQLAKWIAKCIKDTINLTNGNRKYTDNIVSEKWWVEWLKQPHKE